MYCRVFGAGYPSLATMTVDDWYEQHRQRGCLPDQGIPRSAGAYIHIERFCRHRLYWECINGWLNDFVLQSCFHLAQIIKWLCLSSSADGDVEEDERAERERKEENGDEEALQKARDWDDWKDTHRRGYGNRKNMGWSDFTHSHTHASLQFPQINLPMLPICDMDTADNGTVVVS